MKLTKILGFAMVAALAIAPAVDAQAQKKSTAKKTTTTRTTAKKTTATRTTAKKPAAAAATPVSMAGRKYIGPAKIQGFPADVWTELTFNADNKMNGIVLLQDIQNETCTAKKSGKTITVEFATPFGKPLSLKSTDSGDSFTGTFVKDRVNASFWLIEVPYENVPVNLPTEEVEKIVASPDGYTLFIKGNQNGQAVAFTVDFTFDGASHTYKMVCDNAMIQKIFGKMSEGGYSIDGDKITIDVFNDKKTGTIYNDGNFITIPLGKSSGIDMEMIFIR
ncbi:MAG: hypothetical protein NC328_07455 [Muribaculum sp.]|nr:hypothetical protein [Muribaculum sp.]